MDSKQKRQSLVEKFYTLRKLALKKGIRTSEIQDVLKTPGAQKDSKGTEIRPKQISENEKIENVNTGRISLLKDRFRGFLSTKCVFILGLILGISLSLLVYFVSQQVPDPRESKCLIINNQYTMEFTRPMAHCDFCRSVYDVATERKISSERFEHIYSYSYKPVLIKEATENWTAMSVFSFDYFRDLYNRTVDAYDSIEEECQFFPYKTEFMSLREVFNMSDARATFQEGEKPWYIGWSNCHKEVREELRKHYERPYFLPSDSESSSLDWIFMGGSGPGALVHIDYVQKPSWQAQISGKKTWSLIPPPECENECRPLNVTVHKGDIIVVDTNLWYHSTFVHPGEISITIGSEYD